MTSRKGTLKRKSSNHDGFGKRRILIHDFLLSIPLLSLHCKVETRNAVFCIEKWSVINGKIKVIRDACFYIFSDKAHVILFSLIAAKWLITGWFTETIHSLGSVSNLAGVGFEIQG